MSKSRTINCDGKEYEINKADGHLFIQGINSKFRQDLTVGEIRAAIRDAKEATEPPGETPQKYDEAPGSPLAGVLGTVTGVQRPNGPASPWFVTVKGDAPSSSQPFQVCQVVEVRRPN